MKCILSLAPLLVAASLASSLNQNAEEGKPNFGDVSLEVLLDSLPGATEESYWDERQQVHVVHPAVAELEKRLDSGAALSDTQWRRALLRSGAIRSRETWPVNEPYALSMRTPTWLGVTEIKVVPRREGLSEAKAGELYWSSDGTDRMAREQSEHYQAIGELPVGKHKLEFDVLVERGESWMSREGDPKPGLLWKGTLSLSATIVDGLDKAIPPRQSENLAKAVRSSIGLAYGTWHFDGEPRRTAILVVDPDTEGFSSLASTALSLKIEVLHGQEVVQESLLVASCHDELALWSSVNNGPNPVIGFMALENIPPSVEEENSNWFVRITGTDKHVITLWNAKTRWAGSTLIPLAEARERELERAGTDGREPWTYSPTWR